jgi:hypothetical protein
MSQEWIMGHLTLGKSSGRKKWIQILPIGCAISVLSVNDHSRHDRIKN